MALALDSSDTFNDSAVTDTDLDIAATIGSNLIVVVSIYAEQNTDARTVVSVTSPNLTWARRKALSWGHSGGTIKQNLETWWAYASAPLSHEIVNITWSGEIDDAAINWFAVSGVDASRYSDPWDEEATLPQSGSNVTGSAVSPTPNLTTLSNDVFAFITYGAGSGGFGNVSSEASGWDVIEHGFNGGGANYGIQDTYSKIFSVPQSATDVTLGGTTRDWGFILDAITELGGGGGGALELSASLEDEGGLEGTLDLGALELSGSLSDDNGVDGVITILPAPNNNGPQLMVICTGI